MNQHGHHRDPGPDSGGGRTDEAGRGLRSAALDDLYGQHRRTLFRYCYRLLGNRSDAEDAVQETFAGAARYLDSLSGDPLAYLTAVARRVCARERARRQQLLLGVPEDVRVDAAFEDDTATRVLVEEILAALPADNRRVLRALAAGFSYADIAHALSLSVTAVSTCIWRARRRARDIAEGASAALFALPLAALRRMGRVHHHILQRLSSPEAGSLTQTALGFLASLTAIAVPGWASVQGAVPAASHVATGVQGGRAGGGAVAELIAAEARPPIGDARPIAPVSTTPQIVASAPHPSADANPLVTLGVQPAAENQTWFTESEASPGYDQDHTVFASGVSTDCARPGGCPQLFRSDDGGVTWTNAGGFGFPGGTVMLPPDFPVNRTIFASNSAGVARSDDAGKHFTTVLQAGGPAAVDPYSPPADTHVFVAAPDTVVYSQHTGRLLPSFVLSPTLLAGDVMYSGDSQHVDISGFARRGVGPLGAVSGTQEVLRCSITGDCQTLITAPSSEGGIALTAPTARAGVVVAWTQKRLWLSTDDGRSFGAPHSVDGSWIGGVSVTGRVVVAALNAPTSSGGSALLESADGGAHWQTVVVQGGMPSFTTVVVLPDGELVGGGSSLGMRRSLDGGRSWQS